MIFNKYEFTPLRVSFNNINELLTYCKNYVNNNILKIHTSPKDQPLKEHLINTFMSKDPKLNKYLLNQQSSPSLTKYIAFNYPEYCKTADLLLNRPHYPRIYASTTVVEPLSPIGDYINKSFKLLNYKTKPSEDRIRHFRIEEIYNLYDMPSFLGVSNDHRYTELEILGLYIYLLYFNASRFYIDLLQQLVVTSDNGLTLRARIKPYSISIKRWPDYWTTYLGQDLSPYIEFETVLGYIIAEKPSETMLADLITTFTTTPINYYDRDQYWTDLDNILDAWSTDDTINDIDYETFLNSWDLWTTSGACSDMKFVSGSKKYRLSKASLLITTTPADIFANRHQPSKVAIKAETGKARFVYATPTFSTLANSYLLYKYSPCVTRSQPYDFTAMSVSNNLLTSCTIADNLVKNFIGSSDIEKNDHIHNSVMDMYYWAYIMNKFLKSSDIPLFLEVASLSLFNWIFIRGFELKADNVAAHSDGGTHIYSSGGLTTGQKRTTLANSLFNFIGNSFARLLYYRITNLKEHPNVFGGDDSIQVFSSYKSGVSVFLISTNLYMTISPLKSFVSHTSAEFFRVGYNISRRFGYPCRLVHSLVSANPVSAQVIDLVSKFKSMYSNIQQLVRRLPESSSGLNSLFMIYYSRYNLPIQYLHVTVANGGIGILEPIPYIIRPPIPRFRLSAHYLLNLSWFTGALPYLNPDNLRNVDKSYLNDMKSGLINIDARSYSRNKYKLYIMLWTSKVKIRPLTEPILSTSARQHLDMLTTASSERYKSLIALSSNGTLHSGISSIQKSLRQSASRNLIRIISYKDTRLVSDIINRAEFDSVKQKISYLISKQLVRFSHNVINRLPANQLLQLVLDYIPSNMSTWSLPSDMNNFFSPIQSLQQRLKVSLYQSSLVCWYGTASICQNYSIYYSGLVNW